MSWAYDQNPSNYVGCVTSSPAYSGAYSISFWVKLNATPDESEYFALTQLYGGGFDYDLLAVDSGGKIYAQIVQGGGGFAQLTGSTSVDDGEWHHVAASKDSSGTVTVYVDGTSQGTLNGGSTYSTGLFVIYVGIYSGSTYVLDGDLDCLKIWGAELGANVVSEKYSRNPVEQAPIHWLDPVPGSGEKAVNKGSGASWTQVGTIAIGDTPPVGYLGVADVPRRQLNKITFVAAGTATTGLGNTALAPALPAGVAAGDLVIASFYSREATDGTVSASSGWTQIYNDLSSAGLIAAWYRAWQSGDSAPTLTITNHVSGSAGDTTIAQTCAFRNVDLTNPIVTLGTITGNASAQNIGPIPIPTETAATGAVVVHAGKRDDWTSVATLTGTLTWVEIGEPDSTTGADAGMVWDYALDDYPDSTRTIASKTFTVTGGAANVAKGVAYLLRARSPKSLAPSGVASSESFGTAKLLPVISPSGVASAEAIGTAAVSPGEVTISPTGIVSGEVVSTPSVPLEPVELLPTGIASAEAFGTARFTLFVLPTGIASAEAFGTATVTPGAVTISPTGIASAETFGTARLALFVLPTGIGSAEAFGTATVAPGAVTISPTGIAGAEAFGTATVAPGAVTITVAGIGSAEAFGTATVAPGAVTITVSGIGSAEAFGTATVAPGAVTISPTGIAGAEAFGTAAVTVGAVTITPTGIASAEAFGTATVAPGAVTITVSGIGSAEAFGTAIVAVAGSSIFPSGIGSAESFGTAAVAPGAVTISPTGIAGAEAFGTARLVFVLAPTGIAGAEAFGTAVVAPGVVTITPTGIAGAEAFGTAVLTVVGGVVISVVCHFDASLQQVAALDASLRQFAALGASFQQASSSSASLQALVEASASFQQRSDLDASLQC